MPHEILLHAILEDRKFPEWYCLVERSVMLLISWNVLNGGRAPYSYTISCIIAPMCTDKASSFRIIYSTSLEYAQAHIADTTPLLSYSHATLNIDRTTYSIPPLHS